MPPPLSDDVKRFAVRIYRTDSTLYVDAYGVPEPLARELLWDGVVTETARLDARGEIGVFQVNARPYVHWN